MTPGFQNKEGLVAGKVLGLPWVTSVGAVETRNASPLSWHTHAGFELLFVLEGATSYEIEGMGAVKLAGGSFILIPPRARHRGLENIRKPAIMCGILFGEKNGRGPGIAAFRKDEWGWMLQQFRKNTLRAHSIGARLGRAVRELREKAFAFPDENKEPGAVVALRLNLLSVLLETAQQCSKAGTFKNRNLTVQACRYLESHFDAPLNLGALEKITGYGRARLFQLFKQQTGLSPNDFLQRFRVQKAKEMLDSTAQTITETAHGVGFSSSQYFSKVFRKYEGRTPSEWRRKKGTLPPQRR
jgi:AraC-like DNA-binding protein/quercetin dioxygenase-like cupin family protein